MTRKYDKALVDNLENEILKRRQEIKRLSKDLGMITQKKFIFVVEIIMET